jgi:hypothetical protein
MKEKRNMLLSRKAFLNKNGFHSDANIITSVSTYESERSCSTSCNLMIKDCNNKIVLAIDLYDDRNYKNTMHKLNTLIGELDLFRDAVETAREWYVEAKTRVRERTKIILANEKFKGNDGDGDARPTGLQGALRRRGVPGPSSR